MAPHRSIISGEIMAESRRGKSPAESGGQEFSLVAIVNYVFLTQIMHFSLHN